MAVGVQCPCGGKANWRDAQYPSNRRSRCLKFLCSGCKRWRPWCCGGAPDPRCNTCVKEAA